MMLFLIVCFANSLFAMEVKEKIDKTPITALPYSKTKTARYPKSAWGLSDKQAALLPMFLYNDLGLKEKYNDKNATCTICYKFNMDSRFEFVALDIWISEWSKQLLATFKDGKMIDCIEAEVSWFSDGLISMKQWRIDADKNICVTWLKVDDTVSAFADFNTIDAQRIDIFYRVDEHGKFHEIKRVEYQPKIYKKVDLANDDQDLWNGGEVPLN